MSSESEKTMSEQLWVVDFDEPGQAQSGYIPLSWGDMRVATRSDLVAGLERVGVTKVRWCSIHDSKMPGGWGECHWNYQVVRASPVICVEEERYLVPKGDLQ